MSQKESLEEFADLCINNSISIIQDLIERNHLSQKELADILGIAQSTISKNLCEGKGFSLVDLCKIAKHFDVPLDYLIGRKPQQLSDTARRLRNKVSELLNILSFKRDNRGIPLKHENIDTFEEKISKNVNNHEMANDIFYDELAQYFGMKADELFMFLQNGNLTYEFTIEQIEKIAEFFNVSVDYLLDRKIANSSGLERGMIVRNFMNDPAVKFCPVSNLSLYPAENCYIASDGNPYVNNFNYPAIYFSQYNPHFSSEFDTASATAFVNACINEFSAKCLNLKANYDFSKINSNNQYAQITYSNEDVYNNLINNYFNELKIKIQPCIQIECLAKITKMRTDADESKGKMKAEEVATHHPNNSEL